MVRYLQRHPCGSRPWGEIAQTAFGDKAAAEDRGHISQTILAIGRQDTDPSGLRPPAGMEILGASSDHLILKSNGYLLAIGAEIRLQLNYSAIGVDGNPAGGQS